MITLVDLGAPVGYPPYKVVPYGAVGEGCGTWEDSDDAASDELDEGCGSAVSIAFPRQEFVLLISWQYGGRHHQLCCSHRRLGLSSLSGSTSPPRTWGNHSEM